jgi:hypothetical protein
MKGAVTSDGFTDLIWECGLSTITISTKIYIKQNLSLPSLLNINCRPLLLSKETRGTNRQGADHVTKRNGGILSWPSTTEGRE